MAPSSGLSNAVKVCTGTHRRFSRPSMVLKVNKTAAQLQKERRCRANQVGGMLPLIPRYRQLTSSPQHLALQSARCISIMMLKWAAWTMTEQRSGRTTAIMKVLPPFLLGRKGSYRVMLVEKPSSTGSLRIVNQSTLVYLFLSPLIVILDRKRSDQRTRKERVQANIDAWRKQIPYLLQAYLTWKSTQRDTSPMNT